MTDLAGSVVAVTGAGSGIGRALAAALAAHGASLALSDVDAAGLAGTVRLLGSAPTVTHQVLDVADRGAVEDWAAAVVAGHGHVDVLVNNAGVGLVARVRDATHEDFAWVLDVDLWGVINGIKAFLPHLLERPSAHIVNIASSGVFVPFPTNGPYSVAKAGVAALSDTLVAELADTSVAVSCVYPGGVRTGIARRSRYVSQRDAAGFTQRAMTSPEAAARAIVRGVRRNRTRILVGPDARLLAAMARIAPRTAQRLIGWGWRRSEASRVERAR